MKFALKYRKTTLGPLWVMVGPGIFVAFLGFLYSRVNTTPMDVFVPHLAVGYITWLLISTMITEGTGLFVSRRQELLQGRVVITDIVFANIFRAFLQYLQQAIVFMGVLVYFKVWPTSYTFVSLLGVFLLLLNGFWVTIFFGILGTRYRDLSEVVNSVIRLAFFTTPIIWIAKGGQGGVLGAFLMFNPFYHFLELVRAPILGNPISPLSWCVVGVFTLVGFCLAAFLYNRTSRFLAVWA